jgi:hypothetical protein
VIAKVNVFGSFSIFRIVGHFNLFDGKKLLTNRIRNMAFLAVSHTAMYFALVDDRATHYCRFELYETGEPYIMNTYPVINLLVTGLFL